MKLLDWMYTKEGVLTMSYGPHNYGFVEETGAHYFILQDGTGGADDAWRAQLTIAPNTTLPVNMRASEDSYSAFYTDAVNNYNNSILYTQITEHALPYIHYAQPAVIWTSDEAEAIAAITDMQTYVETMEAQFITGETDIDAEWDNYVNAVMSYGYDEIAEAYQTACRRGFAHPRAPFRIDGRRAACYNRYNRKKSMRQRSDNLARCGRRFACRKSFTRLLKPWTRARACATV